MSPQSTNAASAPTQHESSAETTGLGKPITQSIEALTARDLAFGAIFNRASAYLRQKFGSRAKALLYRVHASLPSSDARTAGDGIRYYQTVLPTERISSNKKVPPSLIGQSVTLGVTQAGEPIRERAVDPEGHVNIFLSPLLKSVKGVFTFALVSQMEAWANGSRTKTFGGYMSAVGFLPAPVLDAKGNQVYTAKGDPSSTWKDVLLTKDLEADIDAMVAEGFTIPPPLDWQSFQMTRVQTRGRVTCPAQENEVSISMSEAAFKQIEAICKAHKQPLVYTPPGDLAALKAEPPTGGVGQAESVQQPKENAA